MSHEPPPEEAELGSGAAFDVAVKTDALFSDIAKQAGIPALTDMMTRMSAHMKVVRSAEVASITDLRAEYEALSDAWQKRDLARLNALLSKYFQRRRDLAEKIASGMNLLH